MLVRPWQVAAQACVYDCSLFFSHNLLGVRVGYPGMFRGSSRVNYLLLSLTRTWVVVGKFTRMLGAN